LDKSLGNAHSAVRPAWRPCPASAQINPICAIGAGSYEIGEAVQNGGYACASPQRLDHAP
jgi:hypothetical protein